MNTQSNSYTIIYATVLVVIVAVLLTFTAQSLREAQKANEDAHKKNQILSAAQIAATQSDAEKLYKEYITDTYVVNYQGQRVEGDAFTVDMSKEVKKEASKRLLPIYIATIDGAVKYILPVYGAGLWGPIWGYISLNDDKKSVYGAYFSHKSETPGLGAEIQNKPFADQFINKSIFSTTGEFASISVLKIGQVAPEGTAQVDAISGGTITSQGVDAMLKNSLGAYENFLKQIN